MAVFRIEKNRNYTVMSNVHLKDRGISLKAKGLLSVILSLPEDWNYTTRGLAAICKEGVDSIGAALRELESAGYLIRHRLRDKGGRISDTEYIVYESPHKTPEAASPYTASPCTGYEQSQKSAEKFIALIDKYENFDTLTNTMLNEFVEKILVHERARKGSQDTTQEIEIYFNFLGRYIPPSLQPVPLTPEEQEELRKKEERKDRLHQNYLKRKASGAQKRYEDKIKAKKKAEMDAKKALIRAEDMKKGVFSTIGQLPKEEPRKGSIAASAAV